MLEAGIISKSDTMSYNTGNLDLLSVQNEIGSLHKSSSVKSKSINEFSSSFLIDFLFFNGIIELRNESTSLVGTATVSSSFVGDLHYICFF